MAELINKNTYYSEYTKLYLPYLIIFAAAVTALSGWIYLGTSSHKLDDEVRNYQYKTDLIVKMWDIVR